MKVADIKGMTVQELVEKIEATRNELSKIELQHAISPVENPMQIRAMRRDIARMSTILNEKKSTTK